MDGQVFLRSSEARDAVEQDPAKVRLPDCISAEARDSLLADLGVPREWPEPDAARLAAPAEDPGYRPAYHLTPEQRWMNDPQRPFFLDGVWHYYYLYNADYPEGNGTEWFHATSTDLVHWKDEGVAIGKFRNGLGDIETGTAVVDTEGTAGFGKGAVIAVLTQQDDGVQRQSLFYSTDKGHTFTSYEQNPVMDNPGEEHWRDPRILRDEDHNQWVMLLAEGHKIGFYTSTDLKAWTYASSFERDGLGILECPDFFQLDVDGDPAKRTWVLAAGANGSAEGRTTGTAYWTGSWDGKAFTASDEQHQWLDAGADFYAAVTWDDPRLTDGQRKASRHAIGWMNNWAYARQLPTEGWYGADSVVRDIRLQSDGGRPTLVSAPTPALAVPGGTARAGARAGTGRRRAAHRFRFRRPGPSRSTSNLRTAEPTPRRGSSCKTAEGPTPPWATTSGTEPRLWSGTGMRRPRARARNGRHAPRLLSRREGAGKGGRRLPPGPLGGESRRRRESEADHLR